MELVCHPGTTARAIRSVSVEVDASDRIVALRYTIEGISQLYLPPWTRRSRADELWRTTCFEFFVRPAAERRYVEFNFSPTGQWAQYAFDDYRAGMRAEQLREEPELESAIGDDRFVLSAGLPRDLLPVGPLIINLTAVIEQLDGAKSYWALAHPDGPPDFHDPACFVLELPAVG